MSVVQRLHLPVATRSVDKKNLTVDIVASTPSVDSYGTVIDPKGWDVEQFKRNPVITWAHDDRGFTGSDGLPIANALPETVRVENGQLKMRLRFTPEDVNPFGYKVFRMIAEGFIHGVSVGFDPDMEETDTMTDGDGDSVQIFRSSKLLEVAVVTIPSNDDALIQRARQLNREGDLERIRSLARNVEKMARDMEDDDTTLSADATCGRSDCAGPGKMDACAMGKQCDCRCHERAAKPTDNGPEDESPADEGKEDEKEQKSADLPAALHDMAQKMTAEYVQKCISYFERKQKPNKAATRVLAKFYKIRGDEPPADEVAAWKGVEEKLEEVIAIVKVEEVKVEEVKTEEKPADVPAAEPTVETPAESTPETPASETAPAEAPAEPAPETPQPVEAPAAPVETPVAPAEQPAVDVTPPEAAPTPPITQSVVEEAPQPARKAFVQLPLPVLLLLRKGQNAAVREAAAEALRQGIPPESLVGMFAALEK